MATWESSGQWMFSCYSPEKGKPNVSDFPEISPEELRLGYYICRAKEGTGLYIIAVHQYVQQWRNRLQELKALNAWRTASMALQPTAAAVLPACPCTQIPASHLEALQLWGALLLPPVLLPSE
ncbi:nucleoporin NUP42-like isoform X2 [Tympanuchus pallidicinctus]|uniref:nucleoporin NUP42-like isoform X2 n=1 Tax=Tympanuchus pallidicinctus TaxID=109042 RepID=UPI0022875C29|nr:nucleoporin NUP42-like isoform X2 [Tympanuchus pallidicinctus]